MRISEDLTAFLPRLYLPLAAWLQHRAGQREQPLVVGLCGAQGSGKSTLARLLAAVMETAFECHTATFSIDDLYKTREERARLARQVHPLFATRGVPFTHDVALGLEVLKSLGGNQTTRIPSFDKALDTRRPKAQWPTFSGAANLVLFEGWCVGAIPQSDNELRAPVNQLERDEDRQAIWRRRVNQSLHCEYRELFAHIDILILLAVPGMQQVFEWRRLQEHKLRQHATATRRHGEHLQIMSDTEVARFIMHYERLTRYILAEMPSRADIVIRIDATHNPAGVCINSQSGARVL